METSQQNQLAVPIAIVVAGALIAGSLFFVGKASPKAPAQPEASVPPVTAADHILGNPNADVIVIEYTDLECPFCKQFHGTMKQILAEYGPSGKVAWVLRNFPLEQLHPNAPKLAEAAECVAKLGGNEAYFKYLDILFDKAPLNERTDMARVSEYAAQVGVDSKAHAACVASGETQARITDDFNAARTTGGQGTPHNILVTKDGKTTPLPGAQPFATVKSVVDTLLR